MGVYEIYYTQLTISICIKVLINDFRDTTLAENWSIYENSWRAIEGDKTVENVSIKLNNKVYEVICIFSTWNLIYAQL